MTPVCFILDGSELAFACRREGLAQLSAEPDQIKRIGVGIANRYYPSQPPEALAESFVQGGFTAVRISITNVIARASLG